MERVTIWALLILIFLIFPKSNSVEDEAKKALVRFMDNLSLGNAPRQVNFGWNVSSDPCRDKWHGVFCDEGLNKVVRIVLERLNLDGGFEAFSLCEVKSVKVLSLQYNNLAGNIPAEIEECKSLTHLYLSGNEFSGELSDSLSLLRNLKRLHIANNKFYGDLPNLSRIPGLTSFLAENNGLSGSIPGFDFSEFDLFNVSNNNFSGAIPDVKGQFKADSFMGNPYLCGEPLPNDCPQVTNKEKPKKFSVKSVPIYSGYAILGMVILFFVAFKFLTKKKPKEGEEEAKEKSFALDKSSSIIPTTFSGEFKNGRSEYSLTSMESGFVPSLTVLTSSMASGLTFEELLQAPAELLGRGSHGSLYKVMLRNGLFLAVKRIKNSAISCEDFDRRMKRIHQVKHQNVLPIVAFYSSRQEKLLVYEYQQNGSLFKLLHGAQNGQVFGWRSRLSAASTIAEALTSMHDKLQKDEIAHGNLKSTNILFNESREPLISEYGLTMAKKNQGQEPAFKADVYAFGVILLELLTGKLVHDKGFELTNWVRSTVREEWTGEVFDKELALEGGSEERMVKLLRVSLQCISPCLDERPAMKQVLQMIKAIEEEEENSVSFAA